MRNDGTINTLDCLFTELNGFRGKCGLVFRGQSNASWPLQPKIDRNVPDGLDYSERLCEESALIEQFCAKASPFLGPHERTFLTRDKVLSLTVMQHYGAPTRLLDWTQSPFIAAYFACIQDESEPGSISWVNHERLSGVWEDVWTRLECGGELDPPKGNLAKDHNRYVFRQDAKPLIGLVFFTDLPIARAHAQRGLFTIGSRLGYTHDRMLHDMMPEESGKAFGQLIISKDLKKQAVLQLERMGIDATSLSYNGADRCGLEMSWDRKLHNLSTEEPSRTAEILDTLSLNPEYK